MIVLIDTSTPVCRLILEEESGRKSFEWQADRQLAKGLLKWLDERLKDEGKSWPDLTAIAAFEGPGSFTGLRIGLTVMNTLSESLAIPIVGARGKDWADVAIKKLNSGANDRVVLPYYGSDARITIPRK